MNKLGKVLKSVIFTCTLWFVYVYTLVLLLSLFCNADGCQLCHLFQEFFHFLARISLLLLPKAQLWLRQQTVGAPSASRKVYSPNKRQNVSVNELVQEQV